MSRFGRACLLLGLIVVMATGVSCSRRLIPDAELHARFQSHRAVFDTLAAMAVADTELLSVSHVGSSLGVHVRGTGSGDRLLTPEEVRSSGRSEYGRLLGVLGLTNLARQAGPSIRFPVQADRLSLKGITFTQERLAPLRESLDELDGTGTVTTAYVQIAPRWYLFIEPRAE